MYHNWEALFIVLSASKASVISFKNLSLNLGLAAVAEIKPVISSDNKVCTICSMVHRNAKDRDMQKREKY